MDPISKTIKTIYIKNGLMKMRSKENKLSVTRSENLTV